MVVKVVIHGVRGEKLEIDLCDTVEQLKNITVLDLKRRITKRNGVAESEQIILLHGENLKDNGRLSDYGVTHKSIFRMRRSTSDQEPGAGGMGDKKGKNRSPWLLTEATNSTEMDVKVNIKTLTGKNIEIKLCDTEEQLKNITVLELKEQIYKREGIPEDQIRLIFAGKQLDDGRQLSDYEVKHMSVIHLVLKLRGGHWPGDEQESSEEEEAGGMGDRDGRNISMDRLDNFQKNHPNSHLNLHKD